jgi:hypothetical protein
MKSKYSTGAEWFSPRLALASAIWDGVAALPANSRAGLTGGSTKYRMKARTLMRNITTTHQPRRRAIRVSNCYRASDVRRMEGVA